ncbi:MAG: 1,4-dihydroxy-2-naphthoate polyprenyltransferase [Acidimicrobiaceae bacterium]|nr:1,4-dihydroxy-2-naphthoate polyprenyltransferase [Acidimicrobiaceae bacterium]
MPQGASLWIAGARPKTLPAAVVPVAVGTAAAVDPALGWDGGIIWWRAAFALVVALALQIATNYANDYSDGIRGTDDDRAGPLRLVGSGIVDAKKVKQAAFASFGVAAAAGLALTMAVGPELIGVGLASILAGWFYTGGKNPYGYMGLGELFVFVFFGLVATVGSAYIQPGGWSGMAWLVAVAVGCLSTALLVTNNLRDIPTDSATGKITLAVRLGDARTRWLFVAFLALPFVVAVLVAIDRPWALLALAALPLAVRAGQPVRAGAMGRDLIPVLEATGKTQLVYGILLTAGLWIG